MIKNKTDMYIKKFESYSSYSSLNKVEYSHLLEISSKLPKKEVDIWDLETIIEELRLDYYNLDSDKFEKDLFEIREIYNNPHQSDENSYRSMLFFGGEFNCVFGYTGDRGSNFLEFKDLESFNKLYNYLLSLSREDRSDLISSKNYIDLSDDYTNVLVLDGDLYYNLKSPKWGYYDKNKPLYELLSDTELVEVKFKRYKTDKSSWQEKDDDKFIIVEKSGEEVEIPYYKVFQKQTK